MAGDDQGRRVSPLWHYMQSMALTPPPPQARGEDHLPPREITEADLRPLREGFDWRPTVVLRAYGPSRTDPEYLPRLLVACAILQGVHKLQELTERLIALNNVNLPRVNQMVANDALLPRRGELKALRTRLNTARMELVATRARAANDADADILNPDGLRYVDLAILTEQTETCVLGQEVASRRNVAGIDFGTRVAGQQPHQEYAEEWCDRVLGGANMHGLLLFTPREYARVVVVYADGRLAYDPGAPVPEGADDPSGEDGFAP